MRGGTWGCLWRRQWAKGSIAALMSTGEDGSAVAGLRLLGMSAVSGLVARCFVHPADTLRARMMGAACSQTLPAALRGAIAEGGLPVLYRGFAVTMLMQAPAVATYLTTYETAKAKIPLRADSPLSHLAAGLCAEAVSCVFWVPMEVVKQRAQMRAGPHASSSAALRDLLRGEGPQALYRGYWLTIATFGPYAMFYWVGYEQFKLALLRRKGNLEQLTTPEILMSAGTSAGAAAALTTPLDVVKTRIQTQYDVQLASVGARTPYRGASDAIGTIFRADGWRGFTRGLSARVLWIAPQTAITMAVFERLKSLFL